MVGVCLGALALHSVDCQAICNLACNPSNASTAFWQIQLLSPASGGGYVLNAGHAGWPLSLDNTALVHAIGGEDSVLIGSSRLHGVSINLDGSVTYTLPANTRANRIAAIVTANDGTDPVDYDFPLLFVSATFSDGRHWGVSTFDGDEIWTTKALAFGHDVRNWSNQVAPSIPLFVAPPPAPQSFQLYAGPSISGPDSVFYDLQVVDIPDTLRNTALSTLTFSSVSVFTTTTGAINGLVVWPSFEIRNRQGGALGLQQQYTGGWQEWAYGGYVLRDTLFGAFKRIQAKGCILSCMAMATSYFGDSVRVDQVNDYLVRHHGYGRDPVVRITSLTGQEPGATLAYAEIGDAAKLALHPRTAVNDTLLFEDETARAWRAPVVTAVVGPAHGQATILRRHQHGVLSVGSHGFAYVGLITSVVTDSLAQGHWTLTDLGRSPASTPQRAEQALTDSLPVLLDVCGTPRHFVLARGWKPTVGVSSAHGTYVINDPGHSISRLSDSKFNNTFARARTCQRTNPPGTHAPAALTNDLSIVVSGGGHAGIVAPNGEMLYYDPATEAYGGTLGGADAWPGYMSTLDDDPDAGSPASDYVTITGIADGDYRVLVTADQPGSYALDARLNDVNGEVPQATGDCTITSSGACAFNVHVETGATPVVRIDTVGTASAGEQPTLGVEMIVRPNPTHGLFEVGFSLPGGGLANVEVFDVAGRKIGRIFSSVVSEGWRTVKWDARSVGRMSSGLYFVRMSSDRGSIVRRVVLMD